MWYRPCLLLLFIFCLNATGQPRFKGVRENLGKEVNDDFSQVRPVFSTDGTTLYFSQGSGKNMQYEVWRTLTDSTGRLTGKQPVKSLNPNTTAPKYVLQSQPGQLLVNGQYDIDNGTLQYSRGLSAIHLSDAADAFVPTHFTKLHNRVLDSVFRRRNIYPVFHPFSQVWYWAAEDGMGSSDIYILPVGKNAPAAPVRLPVVVNSRFQETAPWLSDDGRYLYFASDRPGGLGETDIWVAERLDATFTNWSNPVNMGPAINTNKSEKDFVIDPGNVYAYVVSDKNGFGSDDIFRIAVQQNENEAAISPIILPSDKPDTSLQFQPAIHRINNIIFLLDISHSMAESRKMIMLKKALYRLVQQLRPADRISIVVFGSGVEVLLSPQFTKNKAAIYDAIQLLNANGGATNISGGLQRAFEQADLSFLKDGNNQLLLVTDGVFSLKPADEQLVLRHPDILFTTVIVGNNETVNKAVAPLVEKANGQLIQMDNESGNLNLLLENIRMNSRAKN